MANLCSCQTCETCNSCETCNACEGCNKCEKCDNCNAICNSSQALCKIGSQVLADRVGEFSWRRCASSGEIMGPGYFDINVWNTICSFIDKRTSVGSKVSGGSHFSDNTSITPSNPAFTASEFNRVAGEVGASRVNRGDVIYGSYFSSLEDAANSYKFSSLACDNCNTSCNANCDGCIDCNNCQGCDAGKEKEACMQGCHHTYCCSCDTCQYTPPAPSSG